MDGSVICGGERDQRMGTMVIGGGGERQVGGGQRCD